MGDREHAGKANAGRQTPRPEFADSIHCYSRPEGVPLKETLWLCLKQLGLTYEIKDGFLQITSEDEAREPNLEDSFVIVGHCLLALLAAGLGAVAAPMVAGVRREPPGRIETAHTHAPTLAPEGQTGLSAGVKSGEDG